MNYVGVVGHWWDGSCDYVSDYVFDDVGTLIVTMFICCKVNEGGDSGAIAIICVFIVGDDLWPSITLLVSTRSRSF